MCVCVLNTKPFFLPVDIQHNPCPCRFFNPRRDTSKFYGTGPRMRALLYCFTAVPTTLCHLFVWRTHFTCSWLTQRHHFHHPSCVACAPRNHVPYARRISLQLSLSSKQNRKKTIRRTSTQADPWGADHDLSVYCSSPALTVRKTCSSEVLCRIRSVHVEFFFSTHPVAWANVHGGPCYGGP